MSITVNQLEKLAVTHDVAVLTEEEERLIYSFREFKLRRHKPGAVFAWQTHPEIAGGEVQSRIIHPDSVRASRLLRIP